MLQTASNRAVDTAEDSSVLDRPAEVMGQRWGDLPAGDPCYNPNLSRARADFSVGN